MEQTNKWVSVWGNAVSVAENSAEPAMRQSIAMIIGKD